MSTLQRSKQVTDVHIRWMIRRDVVSVLAVEAASYADRWVDADFIASLRQRNTIGMVVEVGSTVVGFVIYDLNRRDIEIVRMAIAPPYRRCGLGSMVIAKLRSKLSDMRRRELVAIASEDNLTAHLFLQANGFRGRVLADSDSYIFTHRINSKVES